MSTSAARLPRRRQLLRQQTRQPPRLGRPQENPQPRRRTPAHRRLRRKSPLRPRYQLPPVQISSPVKGWRRRTARGTSSCGPTSIRGSTISVETKTTGTPRKARTCARRMRLDKGFGRRRTKSTRRLSPLAHSCEGPPALDVRLGGSGHLMVNRTFPPRTQSGARRSKFAVMHNTQRSI